MTVQCVSVVITPCTVPRLATWIRFAAILLEEVVVCYGSNLDRGRRREEGGGRENEVFGGTRVRVNY